MGPPAKRRKIDVIRRQKPVEELTFSIDARQEYLTGFSKRKAARREQAREQAIKEAKEEKIRERKELRDQRKADLETHVAEVNKVLREQKALAIGKDPDEVDSDASDEFGGFDDDKNNPFSTTGEGEALPDDAEYVDEDKYTTVTVEAMDESEDEEEVAAKKAAEKAHYAKIEEEKAAELAAKRKKRPWLKDGAEKPKKKKFRYESKAERSLTRQKQKSKSSKAAKERRGKSEK
ncbi:hypothetical protein SMMN14_07781 [Sphaerulina musiva]